MFHFFTFYIQTAVKKIEKMDHKIRERFNFFEYFIFLFLILEKFHLTKIII